jgi:hypothetical protein
MSWFGRQVLASARRPTWAATGRVVERPRPVVSKGSSWSLPSRLEPSRTPFDENHGEKESREEGE